MSLPILLSPERYEELQADRQQIAFLLEYDWPVFVKARLMSRYVQLSTKLDKHHLPLEQAA